MTVKHPQEFVSSVFKVNNRLLKFQLKVTVGSGNWNVDFPADEFVTSLISGCVMMSSAIVSFSGRNLGKSRQLTRWGSDWNDLLVTKTGIV